MHEPDPCRNQRDRVRARVRPRAEPRERHRPPNHAEEEQPTEYVDQNIRDAVDDRLRFGVEAERRAHRVIDGERQIDDGPPRDGDPRRRVQRSRKRKNVFDCRIAGDAPDVVEHERRADRGEERGERRNDHHGDPDSRPHLLSLAAHAREALGLGASPCLDLLVVAGKQNLGDGVSAEVGRPRVARRAQVAVEE